MVSNIADTTIPGQSWSESNGNKSAIPYTRELYNNERFICGTYSRLKLYLFTKN